MTLERCPYYILTACPYCKTENFIAGSNSQYGPNADAVRCHKCGRTAWLGDETEDDHDGLDDAYVVQGTMVP